MKDATLRRLTARHLIEPDPELWLLAADRCLELGDEAGARLWRRRGELYAAVRAQYDDLLSSGLGCPAQTRAHVGWSVWMHRYPQTVRFYARPTTDGPPRRVPQGGTINVNLDGRPGYVARRLLGLIDRLE